MKKISTILIIAFFTVFTSQAQTSWINWEFNVPPQKQDAFVGAINTFFNSETGKKLPMAYLTEQTLGNNEVTHHLSVVSDNADAIGKMLDPSNWQKNGDYQAMGQVMTELGTLPLRSFAGMPLVQSTQKGNGFQVIYSMEVPFDQMTPITEAFQNLVNTMQPLLDDLSGEMSLHQHIAGDDRGVTHYALESYKSYADYLRAKNKLMQAPEFGEMFEAMGQGNIHNPYTIARTMLIMWNAPSE
ncbi:hypothetical protein N9515_10770 [Vicingaceae bacterium]|nr:hypothetical protein [Vicingaceae bacterium]MDB4062401.1 hypothetical protein [Vicingaceae bacterium]